MRYIETAAGMVEELTGWPVRTAERVLVAPAVGARVRIPLGVVEGARAVTLAEYAVAADGPGEYPDTEAAPGEIESVDAIRWVAAPAAGWPAAAVRWRFTMAVGMSAQQHPEIGSAMAMICQSLFAGHEVPADGWKKLLPPTGA